MLGLRLIANDRLEGGDGSGVIATMKLHKRDIQTDSGHFRIELFRLAKQRESGIPLLTAHGHNAKIGIGRTGIGIENKNAAEGGFGSSKVTAIESGLPLGKHCRWVHSGTGRGMGRSGPLRGVHFPGGYRGGGRSAPCTRRARRRQGKNGQKFAEER